MVGPADNWGSCPNGTFKYTYKGVDNCCCANGCCWSNCRLSNPPDDCLPSGATWTFILDEESREQWKHDGKVGYYQATKVGDIKTAGKPIIVSIT